MILDFTESVKALKEIEEVDLDTPKASQIISYLLKRKIIVPYVSATVPKGISIYRARKNDTKKDYTKKAQISYNRRLNKISLGRANRKGQSIFYASHKLETTLFETSSLTKFGVNLGKEIFTIGRWYVREPITVISLIPKLDSLVKPDGLFKGYFDIIKKFPQYNDENFQKLLRFFSDQFVKSVKGNDKLYIITSEYFNHCMKNLNKKSYGMLFPSVEYNYQDLNLALIPEAVDRFLTLDMVVKYEITIDGKNNEILPVNVADTQKFKIN